MNPRWFLATTLMLGVSNTKSTWMQVLLYLTVFEIVFCSKLRLLQPVMQKVTEFAGFVYLGSPVLVEKSRMLTAHPPQNSPYSVAESNGKQDMMNVS